MGENVIKTNMAHYILDNNDIINLDTMLSDLQALSDWYEVINYIITENLNIDNQMQYKVKNLTGKTEGDFVYFWDGEDVLSNKKSVLNLCLKSSIIKITRNWIPFTKKCIMNMFFKEGGNIKIRIDIP